jgi:hypothetical protein
VVDYLALAAATPTPGPLVETLASGGQLRPFIGPYNTALGRAILPPGAEIPIHAVAESELLVVRHGSLEISTSHGVVWLADDGAISRTLLIGGALDAGDGIAANYETEIAYRATGPEPVEILVVNITQ